MKLPDRGRGLLDVFTDMKARCDGQSLPYGEFVLASGTKYRVEPHELAHHSIAKMFRAAAIVTSNGGFLAVRLVGGGGLPRLDGYDGGYGRPTALQLVGVA